MPRITASRIKYLQTLSGCGMAMVRTSLDKAKGDAWLALALLSVTGVAVALNKRGPDGSTRLASPEECDAYWSAAAVTRAEGLRRERPSLEDDIARFERAGMRAA